MIGAYLPGGLFIGLGMYTGLVVDFGVLAGVGYEKYVAVS